MAVPAPFRVSALSALAALLFTVPAGGQEKANASGQSGAASTDGQSARSFEKEITRTLRLDYLLHLPEGYDKDEDKKWPLLVFLHGAGERGDDLEKVKIHGPPKMVEGGEELPFLIASPQCPEGSWWTDQPVLELIDELEDTLRVDPDRIYLTGLSMGGYGTWHFAAEAPHRFAAIVPICGGGVPYKMRRIPHLPVWAFHGAQDRAVPLEESQRLVEVLKKVGNQQARLTVYPEAGHDSWTESYENLELYEWLLEHQRRPARVRE